MTTLIDINNEIKIKEPMHALDRCAMRIASKIYDENQIAIDLVDRCDKWSNNDYCLGSYESFGSNDMTYNQDGKNELIIKYHPEDTDILRRIKDKQIENFRRNGYVITGAHPNISITEPDIDEQKLTTGDKLRIIEEEGIRRRNKHIITVQNIESERDTNDESLSQIVEFLSPNNFIMVINSFIGLSCFSFDIRKLFVIIFLCIGIIAICICNLVDGRKKSLSHTKILMNVLLALIINGINAYTIVLLMDQNQ